MRVIGYPQPGKEKSRVVLDAFIAGCGGKLAVSPRDHLEDCEGAAFYGVVGIEHLFRQARGRTWFYLDNSFFDCSRGTYFRVAKNRLQEAGKPDFDRFKALNLEVKPWRKDGRHILVVMQSDHFMRHVACWPNGAEGWQRDTLLKIRGMTDRQIIVRHWGRDKNERMRALRSDFQNCWMVVTHASAAANEALLDGIPVLTTDKDCGVACMASDTIESPRYPENRCEWAAGLAARQWLLEEMRSGQTWRDLGNKSEF